jgi:hypothetical protein
VHKEEPVGPKSVSSDLRPALRRARAAGWTIRACRKHVLLYPPDGGRPIVMSRRHKMNQATLRGTRRKLRSRGLLPR